ncbi:hypothetical protein ACVLHI_004201 [Paenibacillus sp. PvR053]
MSIIDIKKQQPNLQLPFDYYLLFYTAVNHRGRM